MTLYSLVNMPWYSVGEGLTLGWHCIVLTFGHCIVQEKVVYVPKKAKL